MSDELYFEVSLRDGELRQTNGSQFNTWLAEHDRAVAEKAVERAAFVITNEVRGWEQGGSYARNKHSMYWNLARKVRATALEDSVSTSKDADA